MSSRARHPESGSAQPVRVAVFTDTLGDVNGVSRFLNDIADCALDCDRALHILTSTRFAVRDLPNLHNFMPRLATALPGYRTLEVVLPPVRRLLRSVRALRPDVIHVSTPGPVGFAGRMIAKHLSLPLAGVYHTDFPAYADRLFEDAALTHLSRSVMRRFYRPFGVVFSRSAGYADSLGGVGIEASRRVWLRPGFNTARFHPRFRDERIWSGYGIPATGVKIVCVGRVSVEKNLPLLTKIWKRVRLLEPALDAQLIIVGDGPYRATMESELAGNNVYFVGFRHGEDLARLYASSDLFVFPSITDTLGQVVLESQASGLPAIVSNVGGPKEIIAHREEQGQTGLVLGPDDPIGWAQSILRLIGNAELRKAMGRAAHRHAQQFSIQSSFDQFWDVHERLAGRAVHEALPGLPPNAEIEPKPEIADLSPGSHPLDSVPA